jgi:hypothetical protein
MGTAVNDVIEAASKNPELLAALRAATTPEERAKVLTDAGITPPTPADVNAHLDASTDESLAGVAGGAGISTNSAAAASAAAMGGPD